MYFSSLEVYFGSFKFLVSSRSFLNMVSSIFLNILGMLVIAVLISLPTTSIICYSGSVLLITFTPIIGFIFQLHYMSGDK